MPRHVARARNADSGHTARGQRSENNTHRRSNVEHEPEVKWLRRRLSQTHREWIPIGQHDESEDYRKGNSSESEQYLYTGNGTDQFSKLVTGNACNDKSDNFGMNSAGSDEVYIAREQMDAQLERHASPTDAFKVCAWNVTSLWNKLTDPEFVRYVHLFDVICLGETFLDYLNAEIFSGHSVFLKPAIKLGQLGRRSGDVICRG